ncbi:hypothetical protein [Amycolatopsis benzoatilytica]|uniref:WXG100-like domain-containing protein n=1 Tax=Amycolatopsis benzoatilytica TaxID=346045 RepID=UPI0003A7922E|nr:hypothetical protein [Amycolatopsis benzoatilytica]
MSLMVDPSLNWVFYIIAGDAWPQGDEDKARELAAEWDQAAQRIAAAGQGFSQLAQQVVANVGGDVATNFANFANNLSTMGAGYAASAQQQAAALREYALNVENAKYGILISIAVTAADLIWAMSNPFTAPLIPGIWAAGRTAVMQVERSLMSRLMSLLSRVAREAAQEAAEEAAEEMLAEFIQIAQGNRDGFDWNQIGQNAALGAIGGAFAAGAHSGLGKWGHNVFGAAGVEAATEVVVGLSGAGLFGNDLDSLGWGALNGGLTGAATHGAHHAGQNLHDHLNGGGDSGSSGKGPNDPGGDGKVNVNPVDGPVAPGGPGDRSGPSPVGGSDSGGGAGSGGSGPAGGAHPAAGSGSGSSSSNGSNPAGGAHSSASPQPASNPGSGNGSGPANGSSPAGGNHSSPGTNLTSNPGPGNGSAPANGSNPAGGAHSPSSPGPASNPGSGTGPHPATGSSPAAGNHPSTSANPTSPNGSAPTGGRGPASGPHSPAAPASNGGSHSAGGSGPASGSGPATSPHSPGGPASTTGDNRSPGNVGQPGDNRSAGTGNPGGSDRNTTGATPPAVDSNGSQSAGASDPRSNAADPSSADPSTRTGSVSNPGQHTGPGSAPETAPNGGTAPRPSTSDSVVTGSPVDVNHGGTGNQIAPPASADHAGPGLSATGTPVASHHDTGAGGSENLTPHHDISVGSGQNPTPHHDTGINSSQNSTPNHGSTRLGNESPAPATDHVAPRPPAAPPHSSTSADQHPGVSGNSGSEVRPSPDRTPAPDVRPGPNTTPGQNGSGPNLSPSQNTASTVRPSPATAVSPGANTGSAPNPAVNSGPASSTTGTNHTEPGLDARPAAGTSSKAVPPATSDSVAGVESNSGPRTSVDGPNPGLASGTPRPISATDVEPVSPPGPSISQPSPSTAQAGPSTSPASPAPETAVRPTPSSGGNPPPAGGQNTRPAPGANPGPTTSASPNPVPAAKPGLVPSAAPAPGPKPATNPTSAAKPSTNPTSAPTSAAKPTTGPKPAPGSAGPRQPAPAKPLAATPVPAPARPQPHSLHTPVAAPKKPAADAGQRPPAVGGKNDFAQHHQNFSYTIVRESGIIGDLGARTPDNRNGIGVVATVPATIGDDLRALAEKYSTGFAGDSARGRFGLVIGLNGTPGSENAISQKIQQFQSSWDNRFPVAVVGFTWKNPTTSALDQKSIPYGGIRETIARNPVVGELAGKIRDAGGDAEVYLHTGDADVQSLDTPHGPLFDAATTAVHDNPDGPPEVLSGGYQVRPDDGALANEAVRLDLDVRQALAGVDPRSVYFPEPNTFVRLAGTKLENDATFGTKNPNTGKFDYGAKEGQGLVDSVLSQRDPNWRYGDHPQAIAKFDSGLAVRTDGTRIAQNLGTDPANLGKLAQSHANETTWADQIGHYLGAHTSLDPNLAKVAAKAAFNGITLRGPVPRPPKQLPDLTNGLSEDEKATLTQGIKQPDGKTLGRLIVATRRALIANRNAQNTAPNPAAHTPSAAPRTGSDPRPVARPDGAKDLPGPRDWQDRRDSAPVTRFSSERFDPGKQIAGQFSGNREGLRGGQLTGAIAHIRFDVRRFEVSPGQWVREHTIPIDLTSQSGSVSPEQREQFVQNLRNHLDEWVNQTARLPGGDQLHVGIDVRVADDVRPDDTGWESDPARRIPVNLHDSAVDENAPETNQLNWDVHDSAFGVTHELMHFLGLGDGYRNDEMLFPREDQAGVMGPDAWHDSRLTPGDLGQLESVSNTARLQDHPLVGHQDGTVLVADEDTAETPDNRPLADRLPEFARTGKALGSIVPVDVRGAKDVGAAIENLLRGLNPSQSDPPKARGVDAITESLSGPEFESFLGDGRRSMVQVGEKWYEVHVTADPDLASTTADQISKLPQPTIGDVKNEVKTTHAGANTDTTANAVGTSYFGMFPAGPYASVGGTVQLATPSAEHTGTTTGTEQRVIRSAGDMQRADVPVAYRITVRTETGGLVGSTVDGRVGLVLSTDLSNLKHEQTAGGAEPKPGWAKHIEFLSPEALDFDENALFDQVSKNLHPSVTKFGAPGRTALRDFLSRGGVRSVLGTAMQGTPVVSNDLLSPHGAHRDAVRIEVRPTNVEYLGTIPGDSELRFNDSAVTGGSTAVSSKYGGDVNAIFGGGSTVPGSVGGVAGVSASFSRKVTQQSTSGTSFTNKSAVNAKGDIGLYKVTADLEVTASNGEKVTVPAVSYQRMGLPEAKAQGLPVPKNTGPKFKDVGPRYEPPYLAASAAAGTVRAGSFEPAARVQPQIENALRNLPGFDKFLPRWDKFQGDARGSSQDVGDRFANLRKIASVFSPASLRGKMDSLLSQGVSAQLKRSGLFTDEYVNVTVKAKPGPGTHLGQADGRSVKNSNEVSPSLTSATTTERGWSAGIEGRVIVPGASAVANLGISPTVTPLQYSDNRTWKNSGGPTVTTTTGKGGSPDSQVFQHDVEFEVEITSYTRPRPWVRRLTPGSPLRVTPTVSTVASTGDPLLPKISGKVDLWVNDGAALTKNPAEFAPGKPGIVSHSPAHTPGIDSLLAQQQNQTTPSFRHVEAFANTEALRDEALRQLQRAAGGDAVLGLPGSEARARVDRMFSPENLRGLTPKLLRQGVRANGFRHERRVADRVGGLGMGMSLSNPKLVAVAETGGGERTYSGGTKAGYEGTHKRSVEANAQLGVTIRPNGGDPHGQGQIAATAKWSPWQRSSGSSAEITASVDHTSRTPSTGRSVLVQYDANVRLIAESRQESLVNGSITRAGADVHLPGSVFVEMTENEARAEGLLPSVEPRTPTPGTLSAPPLVGGKSSSLGAAVLEDAPDLSKLVQDARGQLGKLGDRLLPKSVLDDSMNNLQRTLDTASPEAVTSLVDSALDGGVSLLAQDPGRLWSDNYQLLLTAKIVDTQFLDVRHDGSEVDHVVTASRTDKRNSGHGSSYGGQLRGAGRGLFQDSQPKVNGYDGAYLGVSGTRAKTDQTVENTASTTAVTASSSGPSARYQHQIRFELVVAGEGRTHPVAAQEATVTSKSSADDQKISGDDPYRTRLYGSRTSELDAAQAAPDRLESWQREGFGPLPKSSVVEGVRGAADVRAGAIRALRLAGAGNGLTAPGTGAHNMLSSAITNETLQAHLPDMVAKPFSTPDLHSSAVTGPGHASVRIYTRVARPDLSGLSDSVKLERSDQSSSTFTGEAKATVSGERQGNVGVGGITDPGRNAHSWGGLDVRGPLARTDPTSSTSPAQRSVVGKDKGRTGLVGFDVEYRIVATVGAKTAAVEVRVPQSSRTRMSDTDLEQSLGQPLPEPLTTAQDAVQKAAEEWRTAEEELEKAQRDFDDAWLSGHDNARAATDGARGLHLTAGDNDPMRQMRQALQNAENDARAAGLALREGNAEIARLNELDDQILSLALGEEPGSVEQSDLVARAWNAQREAQQIRTDQAALVQQRQAAQDRAAEIAAVLDEHRNNHSDQTARQDDAATRIEQARDKADEARRAWWQAKAEADAQIAAHAWPRPAGDEHHDGTVEAGDVSVVSTADIARQNAYDFGSAEIQARQITDSSGRVRAVSFLPANENTERIERDWLAGNSGTVATLPAGATSRQINPLLRQAAAGASPSLDGRRFGEWADLSAAPWDDDSLFVFAHGKPQSVKVTLLGGRTVRVDGDAFARIVAQSAPLAQSRSITLISCSTGQTDGPGGLAHDFQRALRELGGPSIVHAPTKPALFGRESATLGQAVGSTRGFTAVTDGGRFATFGGDSLTELTDALRSGTTAPIEVTGTGPDGRAHATAAARELAAHLADALGPDALRQVPVKIQAAEGDGQVRLSFRPSDGPPIEATTAAPIPAELAEHHTLLQLHGVSDTLLGKGNPNSSGVLASLAAATRDGADVSGLAGAVEVLDRHGALDGLLADPEVLLDEIARTASSPDPEQHAGELAAAVRTLSAESLPAEVFRAALRSTADHGLAQTRETLSVLRRLSVVGLGWLDRWHTAEDIRRYAEQERAASARRAAELAELEREASELTGGAGHA